MRKRLIEAGVGLLGLVVIALAVASATLWRADDVLVARATATSGLLVSDPGVLELGGDPVTIRAQVPAGARVVLAVGRDTDVAGWVGTDAHQQVSGLSGWRTLRLASPATTHSASPSASGSAAAPAASAPAASAPAAATGTAAAPAVDASAVPGASAAATPGAAPKPAADPTGSDMWIAQATGTGSAQLVWHAQDGRWSLLVAGIGADGSAVAPTVEMSWPRVVSAPWLVPGLVLGTLLLLAGAGLLTRDWLRARNGRDGWTSVETGSVPEVLPAGPAPALTRRQLRELQSRSERPSTGAVQAVAARDATLPVGDARTPTAAPTGRGSAPVGPAPIPAFGAASGPRSTLPPPAAGRPAGEVPGASAAANRGGRAEMPLTAAEAARRAAAARSGHAAPGSAGAAPRPEPFAQPTAPTDQAPPPWAADSRRARRTASAGPELPPPSPVRPPQAGPPRSAAHEGRPAWAPGPAAPPVSTGRTGTAAGQRAGGQAATGPDPMAPRTPEPTAPRTPEPGRPWPGVARPRPTQATPSRPGAVQPNPAQPHPAEPRLDQPSTAQFTPQPAPSPRVAQPPRPGGWVPVPETGPRPAAGSPGVRPATGRPPVPGAPRPAAHPSWLTNAPEPPAGSGVAPARRAAPGSPAAQPTRDHAEAEDPSDEPSSRADAWRRAWGLPTEPPADERGAEGR